VKKRRLRPMFMRVCCFQKNTICLGCEKIFFPYTEKGSFFCNGTGGFLTTDGPGFGRGMPPGCGVRWQAQRDTALKGQEQHKFYRS
jgi:hypothetical protein